MEKFCHGCNGSKNIDEFGICRGKKGGRQARCKLCAKRYRDENKRKSLEYAKQYRADNREKIAAEKVKYYDKNRKRIDERKRNYNMNQPGGLYRLVCVPTGDVYFGSTSNLQMRKSEHFHRLRSRCHENPRIRELIKLHSPEDFEFQTLLLCNDKDERLYYEQKMIEIKPCCNRVSAIARPIE